MKATIVPVTPFQQNCTVIWEDETRKGAVVDPGGDLDDILEAVRQNDVTVTKILLTHGHADHAAGAAQLARDLEVPIEGPHRDDDFLLRALPQAAREYGFPPSEAVSPDRWLDEGDTVEVGGLKLQVLHCPGHTPGHVVFFEPKQKVALVGDVLFKGSIGRTDFPRGNSDDLIASIRTKLWPLGDEVVFISGHGPLSTFGDERLSNPFVGEGAAG